MEAQLRVSLAEGSKDYFLCNPEGNTKQGSREGVNISRKKLRTGAEQNECRLPGCLHKLQSIHRHRPEM